MEGRASRGHWAPLACLGSWFLAPAGCGPIPLSVTSHSGVFRGTHRVKFGHRQSTWTVSRSGFHGEQVGLSLLLDVSPISPFQYIEDDPRIPYSSTVVGQQCSLVHLFACLLLFPPQSVHASRLQYRGCQNCEQNYELQNSESGKKGTVQGG